MNAGDQAHLQRVGRAVDQSVSMSRPCESVPSRYCAEGGRRGVTAPTWALCGIDEERADHAEQHDDEQDADARRSACR